MATVANVRQIHTGLYTQTAEDCLDSVIGQLSDGIWEHAFKMAKYWEFVTVGRADDGEVLINVSKDMRDQYTHHENGFYYKSDFDVMNFFADKIKQIAKEEFKDSLEKNLLWDRQCKREVTYLTRVGNKHPKIVARDAYLVYETLKGRSRAQAKYPAEVILKVVGKPLAPEIIEAAKKIKELWAKRDAELIAADVEFNKKCNSIKLAYEKQINELTKIIGCDSLQFPNPKLFDKI